MITGAAAYLTALAIAVLVTPVTARIARVAGVIDMPGARKVHREPIPRIGGVVFVLAAAAVMIPMLTLNPTFRSALAPVRTPISTMLIAAAVVFALGLLDDVCDISPKIKCLGLVAASLAVCAAGGRIETIDLGAGWAVSLGWGSWPVTVLWIVAVTVAMNFIDGLDGLAAGVAVIAAGAILVVSIVTGQAVMAAVMLALMGALTGFLVFNFNPAGIFMGDCGSMFLGFMLASASVLTVAESRAFVALALPALALGAPLVDATLTFLRRGVLERRSIFRAERGHIHHRLVDMGLPQRHAVLLLYAVSLGSVGLGLFLLVTSGLNSLLVFVNVVLLILVLFRAVGSLQMHSLVAAMQRNRRIRARHGRKRRTFEDIQLMLRIAGEFDTWWDDLCEAARRMNFARMKLVLLNRDGSTRVLRWDQQEVKYDREMLLAATLPVRQRRRGGPLRIRIELVADGSLESAGESLEYFSRLLDEHSLADLPRRDIERVDDHQPGTSPA